MNLTKIALIQTDFKDCTGEALYQKVMEWGKKLLPFRPEWKTDENLVSGCQSIMYLKSDYSEGKMHFYATSDALISAGLAALLIEAYNGESPENVLTKPPLFLEAIGLTSSLSPGRANGVASLYLKMKQEALKFLIS